MKYATLAEKRRWQAEESFLTRLHGEPPVCIFKRLRSESGLSLAQLSAETYISKNALVRAEQGTYANPLPSLATFWQRKMGLSELDIVDAYEDFQFQQRKRHHHYFGTELVYDVFTSVHPFRQIRQNKVSHCDSGRLPVGPDEVSRALCIPVDTLRFWEKKFRNQQSVPKQVIHVLFMIGHTQQEVQQLRKDYVEWRSRHISLESA